MTNIQSIQMLVEYFCADLRMSLRPALSNIVLDLFLLHIIRNASLWNSDVFCVTKILPNLDFIMQSIEKWRCDSSLYIVILTLNPDWIWYSEISETPSLNPIKHLADAVWLKSNFNEHVSNSDFFETESCGQFWVDKIFWWMSKEWELNKLFYCYILYLFTNLPPTSTV